MSDKSESRTSEVNEDRPVPSLADLKTIIRDKYIGRAGIHGVGLRTKDHAVRVYAVEIDDDEQRNTLNLIRDEIAPVSLQVVFDDPATISDQRGNKGKT